MKKLVYLLESTPANKALVRNSLKSKIMNNKYIILTLNVVAVHAIIATLDMPDGFLAQGKRAQTISDAAATSTYITTPPATITALNALITA